MAAKKGPTVDVEIGVTLQIPNMDYGMIKPTIRFSNIDVAGDVEAQIKQCVAALQPVAEGVEEALAQEAANASGLAIEGFGLHGEFTSYRDNNNEVVRKMIEQIRKLTGEVETLQNGNATGDEGDGTDDES